MADQIVIVNGNPRFFQGVGHRSLGHHDPVGRFIRADHHRKGAGDADLGNISVKTGKGNFVVRRNGNTAFF